ncbi:hypothetical protein [Piscinibacter sakaiensis]|uniref:hypothetical protein n=1 Tax=Piscinibacter sakaiensis TaxID=1547922 RepID=UPI003AAD1A65
MTFQAHTTATGAVARHLLSIAMTGAVLVAPASFAQAPAVPTMAAPAPLEAYTDPGWTGQPQPIPVLRKEARAALDEGKRRCAREPTPQARAECLRIVQADYRLMLSRIDARRSGR